MVNEVCHLLGLQRFKAKRTEAPVRVYGVPVQAYGSSSAGVPESPLQALTPTPSSVGKCFQQELLAQGHYFSGGMFAAAQYLYFAPVPLDKLANVAGEDETSGRNRHQTGQCDQSRSGYCVQCYECSVGIETSVAEAVVLSISGWFSSSFAAAE